MKLLTQGLFFILFLFVAASCKLDQSIMFRVPEDAAALQLKVKETEGNYKIRVNDYLKVTIYTNGAERLIDPNYELRSNGANAPQNDQELGPKYLVIESGYVKLPMVGDVYLKDLTLNQADSLLAVQYSKFYEDVFVITKVANRRTVVMGPEGGKIIPLDNENTSIIEVIALYGGVTHQGKAQNIRLIRGDLKNPEVEVIDLSTIEGMRRATLKAEANDIVYIEPRRKIFTESVRDVASLIALVGNVLTVTVLIIKSTN